MNKTIAALVLCGAASGAFAGTIDINPLDEYKNPFSANLSKIDSIFFRNNANGKSLVVKGKSEKSIGLENIFDIKFHPNIGRSETVSFEVNGETFTYSLADIDYIVVDTLTSAPVEKGSKSHVYTGALIEKLAVQENPGTDNRFVSVTDTSNGAIVYDEVTSTDIKVTLKTSKPVKEVNYEYAGFKGRATMIKDYTYSFDIDSLFVSEINSIKVIVSGKSENEKEIQHILVPSVLPTPENFNLGTLNNKYITASYTPSDDPRISGYILVRAEKGKNKSLQSVDSMNKLPMKPYNGMKIQDGVTIVKVADNPNGEFVDTTGIGTDYLYRIFAYSHENGKYIISYGTPIKSISLGQIKVKYQITEIGTTFYKWDECRANARVIADFYSGSNRVSQYNYWLKDAGNSDAKKKIFWETAADDIVKDTDKNDVLLDTDLRETIVGKEGMKIKFYAKYQCDSKDIVGQEVITWPYEKFVESLKNKSKPSGEDGDAPLNDYEEMTFTWGVDDSRPYSGYKIRMMYRWADSETDKQ